MSSDPKHISGCSMMLLMLLISEAANSQILRGKVTDEASNVPLFCVELQLKGPASYTLLTDSSGNFRSRILAGDYSMLVFLNGYKPLLKEHIVINSGKEKHENIMLTRSQTSLNAIAVRALDGTGEIDQWHIQQFAAVFYDPARVINSHASFTNLNDQSNHLSIRGSSPNFVQWKLEGLEVINPNHLENSGTMNDRAALNGGGVSMISAQILQSASFRLPPFDATSGNALSGIFDLRLRNGNNEKTEGVVQIGLLGTDLSLEGPLSKKKGSSFLVNARYSTIGILGQLGVNFGNEKTNYMDLSHVLNLPFKYGSIRVFGVTGKGSTDFSALKDSTLWQTEKDVQNISYLSSTFIEGVSIVTNLTNNLYWKSAAAYSRKQTDRASRVVYALGDLYDGEDHLLQQRVSTVNYLSLRKGHLFILKAGSYLTGQNCELSNTAAEKSVAGSITQTYLQPFISCEKSFKDKIELNAGLHSFYLPSINYFSLQPRASLKYQINQNNRLEAGGGLTSQMQPVLIVLGNVQNNNLPPSLSWAGKLIYHLRIKNNTLQTELFYQLYESLPSSGEFNFSTQNYFNESIAFPLITNGKARAFGITSIYERHFNGFYLISSGAAYKSEFYMKGHYYRSRFNTGYNFAATMGKELRVVREHYFSVDSRFIHRPGFLYDPSGSETGPYEARLPDYQRIDLRCSYRINRKTTTTIWALDIQNVLNKKNVGYRYFDHLTNRVENKYQLGIVPVLSYKLLF
jgi:hypothetical protein